jgi:type II secretory pathway component PulC
VLAHHIKFDDNKLMINKFKDFLKNVLKRKSSSDSSDQDEFLEEEVYEDEVTEEDKTGEIPLPDMKADDAPKASWKDKFKVTIPSFRKKQSDEVPPLTDEDKTGETAIPFEDKTGETSLPSLKPSWKEKLSVSLSGVRSKLGNVNVREWKLPEGFKSKTGEGASLLSPSLSKQVERFLSREARETIHQVSLVAIICGLTYTIGKVTALALKGPPPIDSSKDFVVDIDMENDFNPGTLNQVRSINIFRTNSGLGTKKKLADTKCEEASQESSLPIKLVNTIVLQDTIKSLASVQVRGDRSLQEVREGDQISDMAKIFKITRLEILVKNLESGVCESIASEKARETRSPISVMSPNQSREFKANKKMSGIDNVGNKFAISKALLDDKMKDIASILTQARAIKIQNPDGSLAFKLTEMDPQGIFPYLGLQDQDIITSINGKPIYDMNEVMSLFARIKNLDNLQLGVKREGTDSVQEYSIKK